MTRRERGLHRTTLVVTAFLNWFRPKSWRNHVFKVFAVLAWWPARRTRQEELRVRRLVLFARRRVFDRLDRWFWRQTVSSSHQILYLLWFYELMTFLSTWGCRFQCTHFSCWLESVWFTGKRSCLLQLQAAFRVTRSLPDAATAHLRGDDGALIGCWQPTPWINFISCQVDHPNFQSFHFGLMWSCRHSFLINCHIHNFVLRLASFFLIRLRDIVFRAVVLRYKGLSIWDSLRRFIETLLARLLKSWRRIREERAFSIWILAPRRDSCIMLDPRQLPYLVYWSSLVRVCLKNLFQAIPRIPW